MNDNYNHFIPTTDGDLLFWVNTLNEKVVVLGAQVGLSATQITETQTACQALAGALQKVNTKKGEQKEAVSAKQLAKQKELKVITDIAALIKANVSYTENIGNELGIVSTISKAEKSTLRPFIKVVRYPDYVEVSFVKRNQPGVSIYCRVRGSEEWKKVVGGATKSPYQDYTAVQAGQTSEIREYKARYWDNGKELGQESDSALIVFGN